MTRSSRILLAGVEIVTLVCKPVSAEARKPWLRLIAAPALADGIYSAPNISLRPLGTLL